MKWLICKLHGKWLIAAKHFFYPQIVFFVLSELLLCEGHAYRFVWWYLTSLCPVHAHSFCNTFNYLLSQLLLYLLTIPDHPHRRLISCPTTVIVSEQRSNRYAGEGVWCFWGSLFQRVASLFSSSDMLHHTYFLSETTSPRSIQSTFTSPKSIWSRRRLYGKGDVWICEFISKKCIFVHHH